MPPHFTVAAVGDVIYTRPPSDRLALDALADADLVTGNLEGPVSEHPYPNDKLIPLKMPPAAAAWARASGFHAMSLANNHAMDYGERGLLDTLDAMREAGVGLVGAGADLEHSLRAWTSRLRGVRVAVLGLASTVPTGFAAGAGRPGIAPVRVHVSFAVDGALNEEQPGTPPWVHTRTDPGELDQALEAVRAARAEADLVIVHVHWGVPPEWRSPFQGDLAEYQRPFGHALIDAGAQLIIGHHAHSLQGAEAYGDGLILYSLGNFAFHPYADRDRLRLARPSPPFRARHTERNFQSLIARVRFDGDGGRWRPAAAELIPARLNDLGEAEHVDVTGAAAILDVVEASDANHGVRYVRREGRAELVPEPAPKGSDHA
jgi:poly-gamma-glutamate synthesis protein (capsule biosynthesis protein)